MVTVWQFILIVMGCLIVVLSAVGLGVALEHHQYRRRQR